MGLVLPFLRRTHYKFHNALLLCVLALTVMDYHALEGAYHRRQPVPQVVVADDVEFIDLDILSYNTFLRPIPVSFPDMNLCRADRIGRTLVGGRLPDIAVFSEAFSGQSVRAMADHLREHMPHHHLLLPAPHIIWKLNGGMGIFSRFPIEKVESEAFEVCYGFLSNSSDCVASKGIIHALVRVNERLRVNVIAAHLDSGKAQGDVATRAMQLAQMRLFVQRVADESPWPIMIAGDFNIDGIAHAEVSEYNEMIQSFTYPSLTPFDVMAPAVEAARFDELGTRPLNTLLCRGGGLAGCEDNTLESAWRSRVRIDYLMLMRDRRPKARAGLELLSASHDELRDNSCGTRYLSDHAAVRARVRLTNSN